jgi:Fic family protein
MTVYVHQLPDWPLFHWNYEALSDQLAAVRHRQGRLVGRMESLGFSLRTEAVLQTLTLDVLKSSEIEGETLDKNQVRSSIARRLGIDIGGLAPTDRNVEGVVEMMLDATCNYDKPLTKERLFGWQGSLFPTGYSGMSKIKAGAWRNDEKGQMQVVSGPIGRERVHFEAPSADRLEDEMVAFLNWFNSDDGADPVLRAGIAHLWFVTIHPFDDGNGRIARALSDMLLARSEQSNQRFYSMSAQIQQKRKDYYDMLEHAQKGTLDITQPLRWFLGCIDHAFDNMETMLADVIRKARFWKDCAGMPLNDRQRLILNKLLDGFDGKLTSTKWAKLAKCSQDTASRDINDLVYRGVLTKNPAGGRSTSYSLIETS